MNFLLLEILLEPHRALELDGEQYAQLVRQGRSTGMLATLALHLDKDSLLDELPQRVRRHFTSAVILHEKQKQDLAYDAGILRQALESVGEKLVLLKGCAYLQAELPVGRGRLVSDIDIIVPHPRLVDVESALNDYGWQSGDIDPYNERYYRQWMHEVPPLSNPKRGSTVDLHHTILPPTAGADIDANLLFEDLIEAKPGIYTLSWRDMVIHSATHLFHEGEFHSGLRDLWDLDRMLRDFPERDPSFWPGLVARAEQLDLVGPLYLALAYSQRIFQTPIPGEVREKTSSHSRSLKKPIMDFMFLRAFRPDQPECRLPLTGLALQALYIRSHYLRMPLYQLIPHLVRKAWMQRFGDDSQSADAPLAVDGK